MRKSQNDAILRYLMTHKRGLTPIKALKKMGCFRLASRVNDLKNMGYDIRTEMIEDKNTGKRYACYTLEM